MTTGLPRTPETRLCDVYRWKRFGKAVLLASPILLFLFAGAQAEAAAAITQSGLNTQVSPPVILPSGETQYDITGGTRPGGGVNLFHSFGYFNVPINNIANFLNSGSVDSAGHPLGPGLPTSNILGRIN